MVLPSLHKLSTVLLVVVSALLAAQGGSPQKPSFGFTFLEPAGIDPYDARVMSQSLRSAISRTGVYRTLEFSYITMQLAQQSLPDRCTDIRCAIVAGQLLGVDYFGFGTIGRIGKTITVSMQIVEVRSGRVVREVSEFFKGDQQEFEQRVLPDFALKVCGIEPPVDSRRRRKKQ